MAFGGGTEDILENTLLGKNIKPTDEHIASLEGEDENPDEGFPTMAPREESEPIPINDPTLDDFINNCDSLSSSASMSDSDLTSTDSDDSLALSESESITDVTPLNSPYCDSPLPQSRLLELKSSEERNKIAMRDSTPPEVNVLMKAIEKLEVEAKKSERSQRRRAVSCGVEEGIRIDQENQKLFKKVISQQSRMRSMYPSTSQPSRKNISMNRHQDIVKSDGDVSVGFFNY